MGMYTELYLSVQIKKDTPKDVLDVLEYMFDYDADREEPKLPNHDFFDCSRWEFIGNSASFYFNPVAMSTFQEISSANRYGLITRSDLKNYGDEINLFLEWINPYIYANDGEHIGHTRYEEDEEPTILYYTENENE